MAGMTEFLVELYAPRADCTVVAAGTARLSGAAAQLTAEGTPVQVVRSIFVAEDETCFVLVEAETAEEVRAAATRAALPFERIVETTFDIEHGRRRPTLDALARDERRMQPTAPHTHNPKEKR
jgi:hypothetical protein